ncbi:c-type cytochrome [Massilia sp. Leaf139]|uniref:c-type cytochrome n=1 Tax=Massilia sp. Leaf139 TaxID=1736272 RepID=UPI0006F3997F|nr:c-type cytochrome [Massilia sp. Leaf139]KQQ89068.1 cytochrome C [Massilia sp. Leaf139]
MPLSASLRFSALLLGALPAFAGAQRAAVVPDTLEQRIAACIACHAPKDSGGTSINGVYFPRIAGKPGGYLYNQLVNFRDGRRQYPMMTWMVTHLPDPYLREIADYFSNQHPAVPAPAAPTASAAVLARGEQLVRRGDAALKVPACIACHGEGLAGVAPGIPGLLNLPRDYVNAQFGAWRNKVRRAHAPDCMATIAERLGPGDVASLSAWLAAQPTPPGARPAARLGAPLPMPCGSAP